LEIEQLKSLLHDFGTKLVSLTSQFVQCELGYGLVVEPGDIAWLNFDS
jgi:hypothetical protein